MSTRPTIALPDLFASGGYCYRMNADANTSQPSEGKIPQYYYRSDQCGARGAYEADCICWHDEGTGPLPDERSDDPCTRKVWRFKQEVR